MGRVLVKRSRSKQKAVSSFSAGIVEQVMEVGPRWKRRFTSSQEVVASCKMRRAASSKSKEEGSATEDTIPCRMWAQMSSSSNARPPHHLMPAQTKTTGSSGCSMHMRTTCEAFKKDAKTITFASRSQNMAREVFFVFKRMVLLLDPTTYSCGDMPLSKPGISVGSRAASAFLELGPC